MDSADEIILKPNCGKPIMPKSIIKNKQNIIKRYCASKSSIPLSSIEHGKLNIYNTLLRRSQEINLYDGPYWYTISEQWNNAKLRKIEDDIEKNITREFLNKNEFKKYYFDEKFDESSDEIDTQPFSDDYYNDSPNSINYSDDNKTPENDQSNIILLESENANEDLNYDDDGNEILGSFYNPKRKEIM